jgi:hypothetical protein
LWLKQPRRHTDQQPQPKRGQLDLVGAAPSDQPGPQQSAEGVVAQLGPVDQPTLAGEVEQGGELRVSNRREARSPTTE